MNTAYTKQTSLKNLSRIILSKLENQKYIVFDPLQREELREELFQKLSEFVLTDEVFAQRVRQEVGSKVEEIAESNLTESDAFQSRKRQLKAELGENVVQGFYFQTTLRDACIRIRQFLFDSKLVEDVFESDEAIQAFLLETIQGFDESKLA